MLKNSFFKTIPFLLFIVLLNSCDKEYNVIGNELIDDSTFDLDKYESSVIAYNQKIGVVQSNNLAINAVGIYDDPSFSTTTANFNTQVALAVLDPKFDTSAKITSVILNVPYFYDGTKTKKDANTGVTTYELDSIYGSLAGKFKLNVYESRYYMRDLDPADQFLKAQKYYTNQNDEFDASKNPILLNNSANPSQNSEFFFSPAELTVSTKDASTGVVTTTKLPPGMQLDLSIDFFTKKLITEAPAGVLKTNDLFKDYFRGLYFQVEKMGSGNQAMIDFKKGTITVDYEEIIDSKTVYKTMKINLSGNTVSLLEQSNINAEFSSATTNPNQTAGDDNLYLKGGEGSMVLLDLFGPDNFGSDGLTGDKNGVADELDIMRSKKYLINEANLIFHVNTALMGSSPVAQRIYLYDYTNHQYIPDYVDSSINASNPKNNRLFYGGFLTKGTGANAGDLYYKFRITNQIRNLVKNLDVKNVKYGVVVTEDINNANFSFLFDTNAVPLQVPTASVMNPLGVILYGGTSSIATDKRLKLQIYYTKPN